MEGGAAGGVGGAENRGDPVVMWLSPWVAAQTLLVLLVAASAAGAQERPVEIVEGKTTKAEIRALYGPSDYWNEGVNLIYDASELKLPLPACLRGRGRSVDQLMIIFEFDDSGILVRCLTTGGRRRDRADTLAGRPARGLGCHPACRAVPVTVQQSLEPWGPLAGGCLMFVGGLTLAMCVLLVLYVPIYRDWNENVSLRHAQPTRWRS